MEAQEKDGKVSLREYLDFQIASVLRSIRHVKKRVKIKDELDEKALELQFNEYERRLTALNHEAQRLSLMIPRTEFDIVKGNIEKEIEEVRSNVTIVKLWIAKQEGIQARSQVIAALAGLISLVAVLLTIFKK